MPATTPAASSRFAIAATTETSPATATRQRRTGCSLTRDSVVEGRSNQREPDLRHGGKLPEGRDVGAGDDRDDRVAAGCSGVGHKDQGLPRWGELYRAWDHTLAWTIGIARIGA